MATDTIPLGYDAHKKKLIAEGQLYRVGIVHSKIQVAHALHPQAMLNGAATYVASYANARLDNILAPSGLRMQALMPLLTAALSFLARRKVSKPLLGAGVAAGALGLAWFARRRQRHGH